jgi:two-component sensor histidine kinase
MAPLAAFGVYAAVEAQRGQRAQAEMRMLEVSRTVANAVDTELQSRLTAAQLIASLPVFDPFPEMPLEARDRLLERIQDFSAALDGADVGIWTASDPTPELVAGTPRPFEWLNAVNSVPQAVHAIRRAVEEQRPLLSDSFATRVADVSNSLLAVPVLRAGEVIAVVTVSVPGARLQDVLAHQGLPSQAFAVVTDGQSRIAAREPERNIGRLATQDFQEAVAGRPSGVFRAVTLDGATAVAAFTDLRLAPGYRVAIAAPASVVEAGWTRTRDLMVAGGAAAALIASLAVLLSSRLWRSARGQLLDQDTYLSIALDKTGLATWESDRQTGKALWSPRHFDILGYPRRPSGEVSTRLWWDAVHPDDAQAVLDQWRLGEMHPEGLLRLTYRIIRRDNGETRWCESIGRFIAPGRLIGVIMDVTDARREEEERLLLAREVDHRSKNLLAVVQAMITMTQAQDAETLRTALANRILSLAKTHTLLAQNRWTGSSVREVAENELRARGDAVRMDGPDVPLRADAVQPLAMALHELATNAVKYGALSAEGGQVAVSWRVDPPHLVMEWRERGGPAVEEPTTKGFGSRMIARVLAQLGGTVEFFWDPVGLTAEVRIPLDRIA